MAHHKPTTENKEDNQKTCGQKVNEKFSSVGHFFQDGFNKLKHKFDCNKDKTAKKDDTNPEPAPSISRRR